MGRPTARGSALFQTVWPMHLLSNCQSIWPINFHKYFICLDLDPLLSLNFYWHDNGKEIFLQIMKISITIPLT